MKLKNHRFRNSPYHSDTLQPPPLKGKGKHSEVITSSKGVSGLVTPQQELVSREGSPQGSGRVLHSRSTGLPNDDIVEVPDSNGEEKDEEDLVHQRDLATITKSPVILKTGSVLNYSVSMKTLQDRVSKLKTKKL